MPTPAAIVDMAASLMNDTAQTIYTDAACLPYLNMALNELQEIFEQNNIGATDDTSAIITIPAGTTVVSFTSTPALPADLIEIRRLWESISGDNNFVPMTRREYLSVALTGAIVNQFVIFAWNEQQIKVPESNSAIDLKIDYVKSIFSTPIAIGAINTDLPTINIKTYLGYKTAALCSLYIAENPTRAEALEAAAENALSRLLSIAAKGGQAISTRRKPFRSGFKTRGGY